MFFNCMWSKVISHINIIKKQSYTTIIFSRAFTCNQIHLQNNLHNTGHQLCEGKRDLWLIGDNRGVFARYMKTLLRGIDMSPFWSTSWFSISQTDRRGLSGSSVKLTIPLAHPTLGHSIRLADGWAQPFLKPGVKMPCMVTFCRLANDLCDVWRTVVQRRGCNFLSRQVLRHWPQLNVSRSKPVVGRWKSLCSKEREQILQRPLRSSQVRCPS